MRLSSEEIRACWLVSKAPQKIPALWKTKSKTGDCDRRTIRAVFASKDSRKSGAPICGDFRSSRVAHVTSACTHGAPRDAALSSAGTARPRSLRRPHHPLSPCFPLRLSPGSCIPGAQPGNPESGPIMPVPGPRLGGESPENGRPPPWR